MPNLSVKLKYLIFLCIVLLSIDSCFVRSRTFKDYSKEDATFFQFAKNDTILDFRGRNLFFDNYLFSQDSSFHFYLNCKKEEKSIINTLINKKSSMFSVGFKKSLTLSFNENALLIAPNSIDKVLLTKINLSYVKIDSTLSSLKRVLKPNGTAIISVSTIHSHDHKKYGNEENIVAFFKKKGFIILKKKTYTIKNKKGVYTILQLAK